MKNQWLSALAIASVSIAILSACNSKKERVQEVAKKVSVKLLAKDFVFGDDRPFAQCHASTVLRTDDGKFLVAWFGGSHEKHDDVGIWLSKGEPGKWSAPVEVAKIREDAHWNPVLFKDPSGTITLFFKRSEERRVGKECRSRWLTYL